MVRKKVHVPAYDYYRHKKKKPSLSKKYDMDREKETKKFDKTVYK